jgi:hypothetical protein
MGIDKKELSKVLLSLDSLYAEHRAAGMAVDTEAEFLSYMALSKVRPSFHVNEHQTSAGESSCTGAEPRHVLYSDPCGVCTSEMLDLLHLPMSTVSLGLFAA